MASSSHSGSVSPAGQEQRWRLNVCPECGEVFDCFPDACTGSEERHPLADVVRVEVVSVSVLEQAERERDEARDNVRVLSQDWKVAANWKSRAERLERERDRLADALDQIAYPGADPLSVARARDIARAALPENRRDG